ncbi:hypothetical protein ACQPXH_07900 [Nocardia sp. CA-135953]
MEVRRARVESGLAQGNRERLKAENGHATAIAQHYLNQEKWAD